MQYTLTKYLTADYLRENDFLRAYLELVDEIIFCCSMESLDVLSTMSFENMDDNYFLAYMNFFLNGLSTYDVNKLDKLILSEWFSLLHVRGELSDIDKLLKFGGSLKNKEKNVFELYHNADVPNQTIDTTKDGLIYLITENNIDLDQDYLINQQVPAGYRIGLIKTTPPALVRVGDSIYLGEKNVDVSIHVDSGDVVNFNKDFVGDITFYRRRQFDQYYTFGEVYRSQYTINQLSEYHRKGYYFFGFELEHIVPLPSEYEVENPIYGCLDSTYGEFFIADGEITSQQGAVYSGTFADKSSYITFEDVDGGGNIIDRYNPGRSLFPNTGWVNGTMISRYNQGRALFELRGWNPGGCFWDVLGNFVIIDSTTGNVISSVQIGNTDLPIDIDVLDPPEIIDPTAPEELLIGVTTECPAGTASLSSEYFWMYQFYQANSANWYTPRMFQNNNPPFYQTDNTMYPVGGSKYLEVILTNGTGGTFSPTEFKLAVYNSAPEFYMDTAYISENFDKNGAVVRYGSDIQTQSLNLPSDMYTISGTTITWDMSHPLMILLQGKPFTIPENHIDVIFGLRWETDLPDGGWRSINFNTGYFFYAGVLSESDKTKLEGFGLSIRTLARSGNIGNVIYDSNYSYEILAVYSDVGETEIPFSSGDLLAESNSSPEGASTPYILTIRSPVNANIQAKSWKCRITKVS